MAGDDDELSSLHYDSFDFEAAIGGPTHITEAAVRTTDATGRQIGERYVQLINPGHPTFDGMDNGINDELLMDEALLGPILQAGGRANA
jgi:hypothetical protein